MRGSVAGISQCVVPSVPQFMGHVIQKQKHSHTVGDASVGGIDWHPSPLRSLNISL